jgi:hypothetical protein
MSTGQTILSFLVLIGGFGQLLAMVGFADNTVGGIAAAVAIAAFALLISGDLKKKKPGKDL